MKKSISILLVAILVLINIPQQLFANNDNYFIVTAYYSPLPDQKYYLKGNYEDEIRLNGKGIAGASGKGVYSGMLAAPKNYKFGTKIYLEGLGVGSVEDRGGAIVNAGNRGYVNDRIDVWMGYGDEGLARALYWGKRKVKGYIVSSDSIETIDYNTIAAPSWVFNSFEQTPNIFYKSIGKLSDKNDIYDLKLFLYDNNFYKGEVNYEYSYDLITLIHDFQLKHNLVSQDEILGAGYWGVKTREKFLEEYKLGKLEGDNEEKNKNEEKDKDIYNNVLLKGDIKYIFNNPVKTIAHIAELQNVMKELELYSGEIDGKYDSIKDEILIYQLDNKLITNNESLGAGYYGPNTRKMLYEDYTEYLEYKEKILSLEKEIIQIKEKTYNQAVTKIDEIGRLSIGMTSPEVRDLQLILKHFGYFDNDDTAIFGNITKQAIISFQLDKNIIENKHSVGAGIYGPNTKNELIKLLAQYYFEGEFNTLELDDDIISELKKSSTI